MDKKTEAVLNKNLQNLFKRDAQELENRYLDKMLDLAEVARTMKSRHKEFTKLNQELDELEKMILRAPFMRK